jgi:nuclear receptor interaction protein
MTLNLSTRILGRESGNEVPAYRAKGLYGDSRFVKDLDIVNELSGHDGCVNALSWSASGRFLASGSDDTKVNIYTYTPSSSDSQFLLSTTINTGHTRNIFSVKFMPHSNDSTILTCAGDNQVRIFDLGHLSASGNWKREVFPSSNHSRVFSSHSGSVKRVVTEDSPFYFLTCSEDGEVRQWDIRQSSKHYPRPTTSSIKRGDIPPALISYANYGIDIYSMSCSPSQPHYIALGGSHLHCFLHDRRMTGRDGLQERGARFPLSLNSDDIQQKLADATKCVAKFAPFGQPDMYASDSKHITACKLGHANPNELIASWTGDHIYSFNILKSQQEAQTAIFRRNKVSEDFDSMSPLKRKRNFDPGSPSTGRNSRPKSNRASRIIHVVNAVDGTLHSQPTNHDPDVGVPYATKVRALKNTLVRTHYSHDELILKDEMGAILAAARSAFRDVDSHLSSSRLPKYSTPYEFKLEADRAKIWRYIQTSGTLARVLRGPPPRNNSNVTDYECFGIVCPAPREASNNMERHERFGYDFCKAVLLWLESGVGAVIHHFSADSKYFTASTRSRFPIPRNSGVQAIRTHLLPYLEALAADIPVIYLGHGGAGDDPRETEDIFESEKIAVRTFGKALEITFVDLHASSSSEYNSADAAYHDHNHGYIGALNDVLGMTVPPPVGNRVSAIKFWGEKVCMALFNSASLEINYAFANNAFNTKADETLIQPSRSENDYTVERVIQDSSSRVSPREVGESSTTASSSKNIEQHAESTNSGAPKDASEGDNSDLRGTSRLIKVPYHNGPVKIEPTEAINIPGQDAQSSTTFTGDEPGVDSPTLNLVDAERLGLNAEDHEFDDEDEDDYDDEEEEEDNDDDRREFYLEMAANGDVLEMEGEEDEEDEDDEDDEDEDSDSDLDSHNPFISRAKTSRFSAGKEVPSYSHIKSFAGHCNVQTTKDVNFYGLQDEYIVSGSDCGNLFIWDKKTGELLNILNGDQEVVNVIQRKCSHCLDKIKKVDQFSSSL